MCLERHALWYSRLPLPVNNQLENQGSAGSASSSPSFAVNRISSDTAGRRQGGGAGAGSSSVGSTDSPSVKDAGTWLPLQAGVGSLLAAAALGAVAATLFLRK